MFQLSGTLRSLGCEDGDSDKFVINRGSGALGAQRLEIDSNGHSNTVSLLMLLTLNLSGLVVSSNPPTFGTITVSGGTNDDDRGKCSG